MMTGTSLENPIYIEPGIKISTTVSATIGERFFTANTTPGKSYIFRSYSNSGLDLVGFVYNEEGTEIASGDDNERGYDPVISFFATSTITYFKLRPYSSVDLEYGFEVELKEGVVTRTIPCVTIPIYGYGRATPPPQPAGV